MKVRFNLDNGANMHSCRSTVVDTETDLGMAPGEWERMTEAQKQEEVQRWADQHIEVYYEEL
jgi:hypothetical protein